jgi:hypothetical protein
MGRSIWGRTSFLIQQKKIDPSPSAEEPERVILKQTPPYNLYGVFPFQPFSPFSPATAEQRLY